jgi:hypothetical protein
MNPDNQFVVSARFNRLAAFIITLCLAAFSASQAAPVTWDAPQQITGESDVSTAGTLVDAFNFAGPATTINGVNFQQFDVGSTSNTVGNYNFSCATNIGTRNTNSTMAPFSSLTMAYQAMLGIAAERGDRLMTLTISGLTVGATYSFQVWVNDSENLNGNIFPVDVNEGEVSLNPSSDGLAGSLGQYVIGTFTADAAQQQFTFFGGEVGVVNGFQLRMQGANVPSGGSTVALLGIALFILAAITRRIGKLQALRFSKLHPPR